MSDTPLLQQVHFVGVDPQLHADLASYCRVRRTTISKVVARLLAAAVRNLDLFQECLAECPRHPVDMMPADIVAHDVPVAIWQSFRTQAHAYRRSPQAVVRGLLAIFAAETERVEALMGEEPCA